MPTAHEVATELRKLADALDVEPDTELSHPTIYFSCSYSANPKEHFLGIARLMPRPFTKKPLVTEYRIEHKQPGLDVVAYVSREHVCTLIEPAKPAVYDCPSLLSGAEEAGIEG